jgi:hypothetical protein
MSMSLSLGLAITNQSSGAGVVHPTPTQRQLIASFNGVPNLAVTAMQSGGAYTANQGRVGHDVGRGGVQANSVRVQDVQFLVTPGTGIEASSPAAAGSDSIWRRAIEISTTTYVATYAGSAQSAAMPAGGNIETDDITHPAITAGTRIFTRFVRNLSDPTTGFINGINMNGPASQGFRTIGGNQIAANGALNSSGSGGGNAVWPYMLTGIPLIPMAAARVGIDSIGQYKDDTNTSTTQGYIARGLQNVAGEFFPWQKQGIDGQKIANMTPTATPLQQLSLNRVTVYILQAVTNDIAANRTLAQLKADFTAIAQVVKTTVGPYGLPVLMVGLCCLNRGTFTGAQNTVKTDYNDWLIAGADTYCDLAIDLRPYQGDPLTYPNDTVHPGPTDHANMATPFAAAMAPFLDPYYRPPGYVSFL